MGHPQLDFLQQEALFTQGHFQRMHTLSAVATSGMLINVLDSFGDSRPFEIIKAHEDGDVVAKALSGDHREVSLNSNVISGYHIGWK